MYKIMRTSDGASLGLTEGITYIKRAANGCFVLCPEPEASGLAFAGAVYHIAGRPALDGKEDVLLQQVDAGDEFARLQTANTELSESLDSTNLALCDVYEQLLAATGSTKTEG